MSLRVDRKMARAGGRIMRRTTKKNGLTAEAAMEEDV